MEAKRKHIIYKEEFRHQAVEMVIHSGKTQAQVARELGCSEYSLNLWKKAYLRQQAPAEFIISQLRRTGTILLHEDGVPSAVAEALIGHDSEAMHELYIFGRPR